MPLMSAAKLSGIINRPGPTPVLSEMRKTTGMNGRNGCRTHRRTEAADGHHQKYDQPDFTSSGLQNQPVAELPRNARPHQAIAKHEQRCDQDDVWIAKARQRLPHREHAREGQRREHDQRDGIQTRFIDREHEDRGRKQN